MIGKKITLTVTDSDSKSLTSPETEAVKSEIAVSEVKLDNTVPSVGNLLTATAYDAAGNDVSTSCTYQWYRVTAIGMVVKIANATKRTYTVRDIDVNATLYCVGTDADGNEYYSDEASIIDAENITSIAINGMSSKLSASKINDVPVVGDKLEVSLSNLTAGIEYQWERNGAPIVGAKSSTYEVTEEDAGTNLWCNIKLPDGVAYTFDDKCFSNAGEVLDSTDDLALNGNEKEVYVKFSNKAAVDLSKTEITISKQAPVLNNTINVAVKVDKNNDGDTDDMGDKLKINDDASWTWYRDSVSAENRIAQKAVANWNVRTWENKESYRIQKADVGHKVICVVSAADDSGYTKSIQIETDTIYQDVNTVTLSGSAIQDKNAANIGEEIKASATGQGGAVDAKNLVFSWTRDGTVVAEGAGMDVYTLTIDDAEAIKNGPVKFGVDVEGINDCRGTASATEETFAQYRYADKRNGIILVALKDPYDGYEDGTSRVVADGQKLQVVTSPAEAINSLDIKWVYGTVSGNGGQAGSTKQIISADGALTVDKSMGKEVQAVITLKADSDYVAGKTENNNGIAKAGIDLLNHDPSNSADVVCNNNDNAAGSNRHEDNLAGQIFITGSTSAEFGITSADTTLKASALIPGDNIGTVTYEITNGLTGSEKKTYETAQVGRYIVPTLSRGDGTEVLTVSRTDGTVLTGQFNVDKYRIRPEDIGQTIKFEYNNATLRVKASKESSAVVVSDREIAEIKILATKLASVNKTAFDKATTVKSLDHADTYYVYVLDSEGKVVEGTPVAKEDNKFVWVHCYKDNKYWITAEKITSETDGSKGVTGKGGAGPVEIKAKDVITIDVGPDGYVFTGDPISYTFTSGAS